MERLQKVISNSGYCSRRKAEELISLGKVSVNGEVITELGTKVNENDTIIVEGKQINKNNKKIYYLLNKPCGYICSLKDEKNRKTVIDLIETSDRVYPVGRLDFDTTGALLLTNDGDLTNKLTHPSFEIEKTYKATVDGILTPENIYALKDGIEIDNVKVIPTRLKVKKKNNNKNTQIVEITIIEGRNHIVKRLFESINHPVIKLKRIKYAFLNVEDLKYGEYRELSLKEVNDLRNLTNKKISK